MVDLRDEWLGENSGGNEVGREGRRGKWWSHGLSSPRGPRNFWHGGGTVSQAGNEFGLSTAILLSQWMGSSCE